MMGEVETHGRSYQPCTPHQRSCKQPVGGGVSFTLSLAHYISKIYPFLVFMAACAGTTPEKVFFQPSCTLPCAALLSLHCGPWAGIRLFYLWGRPRKTARLSNPGLCSADTSGPTLLSDSGCLISTPDRSSGTSSESRIKAQLGAQACWHHHHPRPVYRALSIPGRWCHEQKCYRVKGEVYVFISMWACVTCAFGKQCSCLPQRGSHTLIPNTISPYYCSSPESRRFGSSL